MNDSTTIANNREKTLAEALATYGEVLLNEPMRAHTSFKTGGAARVFFRPEGIAGLADALKLLAEQGITPTIIGNGTNVIFPDEGFDGVAIGIGASLSSLVLDGDLLTVQAGALLSETAAAAARAGLSGFEALSGIPGTVGGAVYMNAGAYGQEIRDVAVSVRALRPRDGEIIAYEASELGFAYRESRFQHSGEIILEAVFRLTRRPKEDILADMKELARRRREKQPIELPSAGSFFKRPPGGYAGALIEEAGLKGLSVGGACVSEKHAGFIVNTGGATTADILALMRLVQDAVFARSGIMLTPEPRIIESNSDA